MFERNQQKYGRNVSQLNISNWEQGCHVSSGAAEQKEVLPTTSHLVLCNMGTSHKVPFT